jgi:transcriptional regulator with XRE-family HTH domain
LKRHDDDAVDGSRQHTPPTEAALATLMTVIGELRTQQGLSVEELAAAAGLSLAEYHDLEHHEDERHIAASVESIARIAQKLRVKPSAFYEGTPSGVMALDALAARISEHVADAGIPLGEFEEEVGWDLADALATPAKFGDFPAAGLRDVCSPLGINWLDVLDGIFAGLGS